MEIRSTKYYLYIYFIGNRSRPPLQFHHHKEPDGRSVSPHSRIPNGDPCHTDLAYIYTRCPDKFQPTFSFLQKKKKFINKNKNKKLPNGSVGYEPQSNTNKCNTINQTIFINTFSYQRCVTFTRASFPMFLFSFFSIWRILDEGKLLQYFWDTLYAQCTFRYGRGIGLEIRSRFESRSKIESVIALHRWRRGRRKGLRSKRHVFERIPGLLRTLYLYVREDSPVCRDPRRHFVPDTEIMGGNSASLRNVQVGGGSKVAWLIALWGFVGQPFIMPVNLVFGQTFQLLIYSLIYCPWILWISKFT